MCRGFFFNKVADLGPVAEKETLAQTFSCESCEIYKNTFFTGHLWATGTVPYKYLPIYLMNIPENINKEYKTETEGNY